MCLKHPFLIPLVYLILKYEGMAEVTTFEDFIADMIWKIHDSNATDLRSIFETPITKDMSFGSERNNFSKIFFLDDYFTNENLCPNRDFCLNVDVKYEVEEIEDTSYVEKEGTGGLKFFYYEESGMFATETNEIEKTTVIVGKDEKESKENRKDSDGKEEYTTEKENTIRERNDSKEEIYGKVEVDNNKGNDKTDNKVAIIVISTFVALILATIVILYIVVPVVKTYLQSGTYHVDDIYEIASMQNRKTR